MHFRMKSSPTEHSIPARYQIKPNGSQEHSGFLHSQVYYIFCVKSSALFALKRAQNWFSNNKAWVLLNGFHGASKWKALIFVSDLNFSLFRNTFWWRHYTASVFFSNKLKTAKHRFWCRTPQKITSSHKNGFERLHTFHDILHYSLTHLLVSFITQFGNESLRYVLARSVILPEPDFFSSPTSERFAKASKLKA